MRILLVSYMLDAPLDKAFGEIEELTPDFHHLVASGTLRSVINTGRATIPGIGSDSLFLKTHYLPSAAEMQQCAPLAHKAVYLVRNPRDVMISGARYMGVVPAQTDSARKWAKNFLASRGDCNWQDVTGSWPQNIQEWTTPALTRQYFPHLEVLTLKYEDVRADTVSRLHQILEFFEFRDIDTARVRDAVKNSSLNDMRALEERNRASRRFMGNQPIGAHQRRFVSQGLHDQSLSVFGADIEDAYRKLHSEDAEFSNCAKRFGYFH